MDSHCYFGAPSFMNREYRPNGSTVIQRWTPGTNNAEHAARSIISAAMWMHSTFKDEIWLWRGQADKTWGLEPAMHSRVARLGKKRRNDDTVKQATSNLLDSARRLGLDRQAEATLPDLALLAHLQHHGAATPLLDVSTDPLVALWMVAFAEPELPDSLDGRSGILFGLKKPIEDRRIDPLDSRPFGSGCPSVYDSLGDEIWWYKAPYVTERLRIQRGSFLLSRYAPGDGTSMPLRDAGSSQWVEKRFESQGRRGAGGQRPGDAFGIVVRGSVKKHLRRLLVERSGLSIDTVFPVHNGNPFFEDFSTCYGRSRSLDLDIDLGSPSDMREEASDDGTGTDAGN